MRLVIATGIYPPEVGGPSYYAKELAEALRQKGHRVDVVTYGRLKRLPTGIRHLAYLFKLAPRMMRADACIALDTFSVAIPAVALARVSRVPVIIRTGGDFLWESYVERTHDLVPLKDFYARHQSFTRKERMVFSLTQWVVSHAVMVYSTDLQKGVWERSYSLTGGMVIGNAVDAPLPATPPAVKDFLWHVRPIAFKNGEHLHAAFEKARRRYPEITLKEGTMPKIELMKRMSACYAVILPSLTEISPNYILDALRFKKPFIMDKYCGLADWLGDYGTLVDPLDEDDIVRAITELASPEGYARACERVARFDFVRPYTAIADDFIILLKRVCAY